MSQDNPGTPHASISIVVHPPISNPLPIVADLIIPSDTESDSEPELNITSNHLLSPPIKPIRAYRPNTPVNQHYPVFTYSSDDEK